MQPIRALHSIYALLITMCIGSSACTWLDHSSNSGLGRDIARQDWTIARVQYADVGRRLELRYLDGRTKAVSLPCCTRAEGETIARNRIALVDLTSSPDIFDAQTRRNPGGFHPGGPVVLMDEDGKILERSLVNVHVFDFLSLSPDEKSFAFLGVHLDRPSDGVGVFVAGFRGEEVRKLAALQTISYDVQWRSSLDWSADGRSLLFSGAGGIQVINVQTGESQKIADGAFARWSPSGEWITYTTRRNEAILFNLATQETKMIDPGYDVIAPIEWSPDGNYLLVREGEGSHVPYGCYWVYRISDSAWLPLQDLGVGGGRPNWIK